MLALSSGRSTYPRALSPSLGPLCNREVGPARPRNSIKPLPCGRSATLRRPPLEGSRQVEIPRLCDFTAVAAPRTKKRPCIIRSTASPKSPEKGVTAAKHQVFVSRAYQATAFLLGLVAADEQVSFCSTACGVRARRAPDQPSANR